MESRSLPDGTLNAVVIAANTCDDRKSKTLAGVS